MTPRGALGADEHPIRARARARGGQAARFERARGGDHAQRFDVVVDLAVDGGVVAGGAGGDPAAQRRKLPGLQEKAQREARGFQLPLEAGAEHARLHARGLRSLVDLEHAVEVREINGQHGLRVRGRVDAADHARAAAEGDRGDAVRAAPVEQIDDVELGLRGGDHVRRIGEVAPVDHLRQIDRRAAVAVREARVVVGCADRFQARGRVDARGAQGDLVFARHRGGVEAVDAEQVGPSAFEPFEFPGRERLVLEAPAVEAAAALGHRSSPRKRAAISARSSFRLPR